MRINKGRKLALKEGRLVGYGHFSETVIYGNAKFVKE
jgi:hypothetical protein